MKTLFAIFTLAFFASCGQASETETEETKTSQQKQTVAKKLDAAAFHDQLEATENAFVLDVRTPQELESGFIKGAENYNMYDQDFEEKINHLDKTQPVFVYCQVGGRSAQAFDMLKKKGFEEVYELNGGMNAWHNNNMPVVKK